jgi:hypothetical protein
MTQYRFICDNCLARTDEAYDYCRTCRTGKVHQVSTWIDYRTPSIRLHRDTENTNLFIQEQPEEGPKSMVTEDFLDDIPYMVPLLPFPVNSGNRSVIKYMVSGLMKRIKDGGFKPARGNVTVMLTNGELELA